MPILKNGSLVLDAQDFANGQANSPYSGGLANVRNVELFQVPGIAKIQWATQLYLSTTALPIASLKDTHGNTFVATQNALYRNGVAIPAAAGRQFRDMKLYKDYLILTVNSGNGTNDYVETYGPLSAFTPLYTTTWKNLTGVGFNHPIVIGQDDIIYVGDGNLVASLSSFSIGSITVAPTATLNASALDLPDGEQIRTLGQLGKYLAAGTQNGSSFFDYTYGHAALYFWDRTSPSFELPMYFEESGINQMLTVGFTMYMMAGVFGTIYSTNKSSFTVEKQLNFNITHAATNNPYPNAIAKLGDEIVIGTGTGSDGFGADGSQSKHGVWSLKGQNAYLRNTISTGNYGATQPLQIGSITQIAGSVEKQMLVGWQDGNTYGVDNINTAAYYNNYQAVVESELYEVGTTLRAKTYQTLMFKLASPLVSGQNLRISYRKSSSEAYTVIGTYDYTMLAANSTEYIGNPLISDAIQLQIKVELSQNTGTPITSNVLFRELILA